MGIDMNQGFILLHRKFMTWEWYQDKNTKILFLHCLLKSNFETKEWQGITIKRGQFFTSINHLSTDLKMSVKEIRTALKKLQKTNEIVQKGASNGTMITICKYDDYQEKQKPKGKRRASEGQAKGKRGATTNNDKQLNNENNVNNKDTYTEIKNIFNSVCIDLPKIQKITNARKKLIDARTKEYDLLTIGNVFNKVAESGFLNGQNKNNWVASFDWIFNASNFIKILEDNYKNRTNEQSGKNGQSDKQIEDLRKLAERIANDPDLI